MEYGKRKELSLTICPQFHAGLVMHFGVTQLVASWKQWQWHTLPHLFQIETQKCVTVPLLKTL